MDARIFKPAKSAMQSGVASTKGWVLQFVPQQHKTIEPIMGWTSERDTRASQVALAFDTLEEAINYAERQELKFEVIHPHQRRPISGKSYSENFKYTKVE